MSPTPADPPSAPSPAARARPRLHIGWQWLLLIALLSAAAWWLSPVLTPFAIAALFAYLLDPVVDRMEARGINRTLGVSLVFIVASVVLVAALLLLVPLIERQIGNFLSQLPQWVEWFQTRATPWLEQRFGVKPELLDTQKLIATVQGHWREAGGVAAGVLQAVSRSGLTLVGWGFNLVLIPVVAFYLLRDWDRMVGRIHDALPRSVEPTVSHLARQSDEVLGAFLRGQLSVMVALGIYYGVALWLCGLSVGPLIGMVAGLISFVPYLGAITGFLMAVIAVLVQYQDWLHFLLIAGVFAVGNLLEGYVLVPRLIGDRIGLHPVAVIFAVLAGGQLFGFLGILLALPVASVVMVLLRWGYARYTESALYNTPAPDNPSTVIVVTANVAAEAGDAAGAGETPAP